MRERANGYAILAISSWKRICVLKRKVPFDQLFGRRTDKHLARFGCPPEIRRSMQRRSQVQAVLPVVESGQSLAGMDADTTLVGRWWLERERRPSDG